MFQPNASSPISLAWNATGGGRNRLALSSMMRIVTSGAAWSRSAGQTPSASKSRIEPSRSATVRPSGRISGRPTRQVEKPSRASASAAAAPTAPTPTTATSKGAGIAVLSTGVQRRHASVGDARGEAHDRAPQALAQQHVPDRLRRPGDEHLSAAAMGPLGEAPERRRRGRVGERHGGQIDDHDFWKLPDALENGRDRAGGAEEEGAGDPVDHDLPVGALSVRIGGAVAGGIGLVLVEKGRPALDRDELRHAVHEQETAEHHADQDAFGEIPEHGEEEGRKQHKRLAAGAGQDGEELVPL